MLRRTTVIALALSLVFAMALPASATGGKHHHKPDVVDIVLKVSGTSGFDRNPHDYDILRQALVKTGLVDALKDANNITVWAPNDRAFKRLARDLGWKGRRGERGAFRFLKRAAGAELLTDVLLYHVSPRRLNAEKVLKAALTGRRIHTLLGVTFRINHRLRLVDKERDLRNPRLTLPINIKASNGIIHTIDRVLIPIDLV